MEETTKILNQLNFYKTAKLLFETCTFTMFQAYLILYDWPDKAPHKLADHLDEIPVNQTRMLKKIFGPSEIDKIKRMMTDKHLMKGFDITLYYKLIQYAVNNDKMKSLNDPVWTEKCPENLKNELEHLLFLVKTDRNVFSHKKVKFLNLLDDDIENFCDILFQRLPAIIRLCGIIAETDPTEIDIICQKLINEIKDTRDMECMPVSDENKILNIKLKEELMMKLIELDPSFSEELNNYCPPNLKLENGTIMTTEELLSDGDLKLICITAEAGFGKTSFTKFVQRKLLSEIQNVGDDHLDSQKIPIRIACRNITGINVSEHLKENIPISINYTSSTSSLKIFLERFHILWIIDGYDERSGEFDIFFESLMKTISIKDKIIVTSRPNSFEELEDKLKEKKVHKVTIECFNNQQIIQVANDYLGEDRVADFESAIERLNDETLKFITIPINVCMCLDLWSIDPTIFDGEIKSIYQLYDKKLERDRNLLISRLKGMANITCEYDLKLSVDKWYIYMCEVVAESTFTYDLRISETQKSKLFVKASHYGLIGTCCLATFFNIDKSFVGTNYLIRHKIEKEILSCVYLKECNDDDLKAVAQQHGNHHLLNEHQQDQYGNSFEHIKFLMECCTGCEFAKIFVPLQEIYSGLQRPHFLLQIKDENYFDDLKTEYKDLGKSLVLCVYGDREVDDLLKILDLLIPDLNSFKIKIDKDITMHKEINDFISTYKDCKSFVLKLGFCEPNKFVRIIQMFRRKGNQHLIKELDLSGYMYKWTEEMKKQLFKLENLNFVSFIVYCSNYSSSMLHHFSTNEIEKKRKKNPISSFFETLFTCASPPSPLSPDVHAHQTASTTTNPVPLQTPNSKSLAEFDHSCHLHFHIECIEDSSKVIGDLLKVNSKFPLILMSVNLNFFFLSFDLSDNLLKKFQSSSVQVKELEICLDSSTFPNVKKLVKYGDIEILRLYSVNQNEGSFESNIRSLFTICEFDKIKKIKLVIDAKSQLKLIYNMLHSDLLNKTEIDVTLYQQSGEMELDVDSKQIKRIEIENDKYWSAFEIEELKSISKSFDIRD